MSELVANNHIIKTIKSIIDKWDPIGLLRMGAPDDEYGIEINAIYEKYHKDIDMNELGQIIFEVFDAYFNHFTNPGTGKKSYFPDTFISDSNECKNIAELILKQINLL